MGSSGDGQKRKVAIVRAAISVPVLVCFKEEGNKLMPDSKEEACAVVW
jgi:ABC-type polar amino acid transport system ATPase subunit